MYFSHKHFLSLTIDENETKWSIFSFQIIIIVGGTNLSPIKYHSLWDGQVDSYSHLHKFA